MRDDFLSDTWADNHAQLSISIHKLFNKVVESFERLHARQFDAPWRYTKARRHPAPRV